MSRTRRSPEQLIDAIYEALPVNSFDPVSHVAAKAEMDWKTAQKYLDLIRHIQEKQNGDWLIARKSGNNVVYCRRSMAGRPKE